MTTRRTALTEALIVPDEQTWTMAGADPVAMNLRPVFAPGQARRLLVPEQLPATLEQALRSSLAALPAGVEVDVHALPGFMGSPIAALLDQGAADSGRAHSAVHGEGHSDHGDHDHHRHHGDMMAIVGEPSADGLVMEPIEFVFGPLGTPLPGGLAVDVTLDGDVVSSATVNALLSADPPADGAQAADPLSPLAWTLTIGAEADAQPGPSPWRQLAALEVERAASHLAWLRVLGRVLGWPPLVDRCTRALEGLPALARRLAGGAELPADGDGATRSALTRAAAATDDVAALLARGRLFRLRTSGLGVVSDEAAARAGLRGPRARASGLRDDARTGHALYERLGFEPVVHSDGDARARILVRAQEARSSLRLAAAALGADADGTLGPTPLATPGETVEGPRGPLRAERRTSGWRLDAPGSEKALQTAGEAMLGAEWAAALVALLSFDLSAWRVNT